MKLTFWLLDINYESKDAAPELWMWGIDSVGNRVLIIDRSFEPYFYAVLKESASPERIVKEIRLHKTELPLILKTEPIKKKYFGKPVNALKIIVQSPDAMSKYADVIKDFEGVEKCLEDDIRFSMRYLIDSDISPSGGTK